MGFNPTLVRLRPYSIDTGRLAIIQFQSHAGSIEALNTLRALFAHMSLFQSHAGSIEAKSACRRNQFTNEGFNPTLVRLRHIVIGIVADFTITFQSHAGSIEAGRKWGRLVFYKCFNPTLVRLRPSRRL